jgi:hypothetical protein
LIEPCIKITVYSQQKDSRKTVFLLFMAERDLNEGAKSGKNKTIAEVSNGASAFELEKLQLRY